MRKVVIGLVVLLLGAVGVFGAMRYIQWRATSEVDAVFAGLRTSGREAGHGGVTFALRDRNLAIRAIHVREPDGTTLDIDTLAIEGVAAPQNGRIAARLVKAEGIRIEVAATQDRPRSTYQIPSATIEDYSGPDTLLPRERGRYEALNLALRQMAQTSAARLSVPRLDVRIAPLRPSEAASAIAYRKIEVERIADGKVGSLSFRDMGFTFTAPSDNPDLAAKGNLKAFVATNIDTAPLLAATRATPVAGVQIVYGQVVASGYSLVHGDGSLMEIGEASAKEIGFAPATGFLERLEGFTALGEKGRTLNAADSRALIETTADLLKAFGFAEFRMKDIVTTDATGMYRFGAVTASGFKEGRLARLLIETASGPSEGDMPFTLESFAIKGFSPLPILAAAARASGSETQSDIENMLVMLRSMEGIEVKGLVSETLPSKVVRIDALSLDWGAFMGLVPTRLGIRMTGLNVPLTAEDTASFGYGADLGMDRVTMGMDMAIAYDDAARSIRLKPGAFSIAKAFSADLNLSLLNVRANAFEDPIAALAAAQRITVGPLGLRLSDDGLVAMVLKARADSTGATPDAVRSELVGLLAKAGAELAPLYPEAPSLATALASFVEKPGTLDIRLEPLSDLKLMDLIAADPASLLREFRITATASPLK